MQIKGYPVRLPLDVMLVFSANPEDYTARGKIITPLKDRIGSEIQTHYPGFAKRRRRDHEAGVVDKSAPRLPRLSISLPADFSDPESHPGNRRTNRLHRARR